MGSTVIVSSRSKSERRVLHVSRGRPLTSALHEPHFAALQFQRTARSGAALPWIQWSASRTTIPSPTGTSNSSKWVGPPGSPRNTRSRAMPSDSASAEGVAAGAGRPSTIVEDPVVVIVIGRILASMGAAEELAQLVGHLGQGRRRDLHRA